LQSDTQARFSNAIPLGQSCYCLATTSNKFQLTLRVAAAGTIAAALCHGVLGLSAERILDPRIPAELAGHASLDRQNRFYGTMFGATGVALWNCAGDRQRYDTIVRCLRRGLVLAGVARLGAVQAADGRRQRSQCCLSSSLLPRLLFWPGTAQRVGVTDARARGCFDGRCR
jgi:hypothetical protein